MEEDDKCVESVDYLDFFVICDKCGWMVKRYHTTEFIYREPMEIICYYCLYPEKYKRNEHPKECCLGIL